MLMLLIVLIIGDETSVICFKKNVMCNKLTEETHLGTWYFTLWCCREIHIGVFLQLSLSNDYISGPVKLFVQSLVEFGNSITRSTKHRWISQRRETIEGNRLLLPWREWNGYCPGLHFTVCHGSGICCWLSPRPSDAGQYYHYHFEDGFLLGWCAVQSGRSYWHFRGACCLHHQGDEWLIALMMEVASTSETLVNFYRTTWCNNPKTAIFILITMRTWNLTLSLLLSLLSLLLLFAYFQSLYLSIRKYFHYSKAFVSCTSKIQTHSF
jgi:hypothetical protein